MIILLKENANPKQVENLKKFLTSRGFGLHESVGEQHTIIGLVGDTSKLDIDLISSLDVVEAVRRIQEPYKNANRKFHAADTVVDVGGAKIGGGHFMMIAGPCSVENHDQILSVARDVKQSGANMLRGGAFKPRTSPYAFQGLHEKGIELLLEARRETGLPIITEIMDINHLPLFEDVDVIQVGARNMQNFELLKELGQTRKPILLKRGLANTIQELLMSAEYIMAGGNENVILCERGIRTFDAQHAGHLRSAGAAQADPPARGRRPEPRHRRQRAGAPDGTGGGRRGCGRPHHRGAQRSRPRAVRRQAVPDSRAV